MPKKTILIIEDEPSLVGVLTYNLKSSGYEVFSATNGRDGLQRVLLHAPDLIVLDLVLPILDGWEVCRRVRADDLTRDIPILMLTGKNTEADEIVGFQLGADDYVAKPFRMSVLLQRVKALLRRARPDPSTPDLISMHGLELDRLRHRAAVAEREVLLTLTEFRLLWALAGRPGRAFTRQELMEACMGDDAASQDRTIDVHVKSIRQKLGDRAGLVETVRGIGYRFPETPPEAVDSPEAE